MRVRFLLFALVAFASAASTSAQDNRVAVRSQSFWRGEITGPALTLKSPLAPLPTVRKGARRLVLPAPTGPVPDAAIIPLSDGGGTVTLLDRWRGGWLVGTNNGEWGGALYVATSTKRTVLARGNVIGGFTWRGHLYIISGLQHLGLDRGEVWEVDLGASTVIRRIPLPAYPDEVLVTKDEVIVRTGLGDVTLLNDGKVVSAGAR